MSPLLIWGSYSGATFSPKNLKVNEIGVHRNLITHSLKVPMPINDWPRSLSDTKVLSHVNHRSPELRISLPSVALDAYKYVLL